MTQLALAPMQLGIPFLRQCEPLFDENFGIFSEVNLEKNNFLGVTCYNALVRMRDSRVFGARGSMGQGGGFSRARACSRALGEAIERTSSSYRAREDDLFGSFEELSSSYPLLNPELFPRRAVDAPVLSGMLRFEKTSRVCWTKVQNVLSNQMFYAPAAFVYMPHSLRAGEDWIEFATSSGLAGGATIEDATVSGLMELAERDAFSLFWLGMRESASLPNSLIEKLKQRIPVLNYGVVLHDISNDLGVPVVLAIFEGREKGLPRLAVGAGAALTLETAAEKALEELSGCVHFGYKMCKLGTKPIASVSEIKSFHDHAFYWVHHEDSEILEWLSHPGKAKSQAKSFESVTEVMEAWALVNKPVYRVDVTIPEYKEFNLCVVRVLAPALQPLWVMVGFEYLDSPRLLELCKKELMPKNFNSRPHPFP